MNKNLKSFIIIISMVLAVSVMAQGNDQLPPFFIGINESDLTSEQLSMLDSLQNMETTVDVNIVQVFQVNIINQLPSLSAIHLNLFPNIEFDVNMTEVHSWAENEQSWIGKPVDYGDNGDYVILVAIEEDITGIIYAYGEMFGIRPIGSGAHAIFSIDQSKFPQEHPDGYESGVLDVQNNSNNIDPGDNQIPANLTKTMSPQTTVIYDLLVAYTPAARIAAGGTSSIRGLITAAVEQANVVYGNSNSTPRTTLVHQYEINYTEVSMPTDLSRLRHKTDNYIDEVHDVRDQYSADAVLMIVGSGGDCGMAYRIYANENQAFAVVKYSCLYSYSLTHEIGHLFGGRHDADPSVYPEEYCHGYVLQSISKQTIMATKPPTDPRRIGYLSNPGIYHPEYQEYLGTASWNDVARIHDEYASTFAGFRTPPIFTVSITGPSGLGFKQWGTFTANVDGGTGTIIYQWYMKNDGSTSWSTLGTSQSQSVRMGMVGFTMKAEVTRNGEMHDATKYCEYLGAPKLAVDIPIEYAIYQNFPNPFNPITTINYNLPKPSYVRLTIYDILGQEICSLVNRHEDMGYKLVQWDARDGLGNPVGAGVYIYRLQAGQFKATRKALLLK